MKAIILAAGEGKRLKPLTDNTPKSMVLVRGQSMLERQLLQLENLGVEDIIIVTGYCKVKINLLIKSKFSNVRVVFNEKFDSSNMVYSLSKVLPFLDDKSQSDVLILYSDIAYSEQHLDTLIVDKTNSPMTVLGNSQWLELWSKRFDDPLSDAETFIFNDSFNLIEIGKKTSNLDQVQAQYMGMIKVKECYLSLLLSEYKESAKSDAAKNMYMTDLIQQVIEIDVVKVIIVDGRWIEMDTFEDYKLYSDLNSGDFNVFS